MKSTASLPFLLAVVLGSVSAALTTYLLLTPDPANRAGEPRSVAAVPEPLVESDVSALIQRLLDLNQELRERVAALELRPAPTLRAPLEDGGSRAAFDELRDEVGAALASLSARRAQPDVLEAQVVEVVTALRKKEAVEHARVVEDKQARALEDRLARLSTDLRLDGYQVNELRSIYVDQNERSQELTRMWQEGADERFLADTKRANAELHQAALERVLTPQQLEVYRASQVSGAGKK